MKVHPMNIVLIIAVITAITLGIAFIHYGAKDTPFDSKEWAKGNHCPYEGFECPNAQLAIHEDSLVYADAEYVIDSLVDRTHQLETQLAGCEFQDHSKLTKR